MPHKRPIPTWFPEIFLGFLLLDLSPVGGEAEALDVLVKRDRFQERHRPLVVHQIQRQVDVLKRAEIFSKCLKKPSGKTCHQQWRLQGSSHPHCSPLSSFVICVHPPTLPTLLLDKFNSWIFLLVMLLVSTSMHSSVRTLLGKQRLVTFTNLSIPAITSYSRVSVSLLFLREILWYVRNWSCWGRVAKVAPRAFAEKFGFGKKSNP